MNALIAKAMAHEHVTEERIFKDGFDYYEVRLSRKKICQLYLEYLHRGVIPSCVEDYAIEVLSERISHEDIAD